MNILEIHSIGSHYNGSSVHTAMLVQYFSNKNGNIVLIYHKDNKFLNSYQFSDKVILHPFNLSSIILLPYNFYKILLLTKQYNIDIIHSHHRNANFFTGLVKLIRRKIKIVSTIHGASSQHYIYKDPIEYKVRYRLLEYITNIFLKYLFDEVIFISNFSMKSNLKKLKKLKKYRVIYNGSLKPKITKNIADVRKEIGLSVNVFVVTLLSQLAGIKRPHIILKIADILKKHKDIYFLLVGEGVEKVKLQQTAKEKKLNVIFTGWRTDVGNIISASNIIVSTSINEGFGRTLTEAMMLSKPVISFDKGGPSEIIRNNVCGYLIREGDILGFAGAIYSIYSNKEIEKTFSENSAIIAKKNYSAEVFCNNYEKEFKVLNAI